MVTNESEIMAYRAKHNMQFISKKPPKMVSSKLSICFHVPNMRLDCLSPLYMKPFTPAKALLACGRYDFAFSHSMTFITFVYIRLLNFVTWNFLGLCKRLLQGMPVVRVTMKSLCTYNKSFFMSDYKRGFAAELIFLVSFAFGNTLDIWFMQTVNFFYSFFLVVD